MKEFTLGLEIKHIPFLQISNPPSFYDLKRAEESARKNKKRSKVETFIRWEVEDIERKKLMDAFSSYKTVYVTLGDLEKHVNPKENNLIGISYPAFSEMDGTENKENLKKKFWYAPQFAFGGYYYQDKLFLIEDIFQWVHHRISWNQIRTAKSIIEAERAKLGIKS